MPLADHRGRVAGLPEQRRERRVPRWDAVPLVGAGDRLLEPALEPPGIPAGVERDPRGRAHRCGSVGGGEPDAVRRETVETRGADVRRPVTAQVGPPAVVGEHDEHIGPERARAARDGGCQHGAHAGGQQASPGEQAPHPPIRSSHRRDPPVPPTLPAGPFPGRAQPPSPSAVCPIRCWIRLSAPSAPAVQDLWNSLARPLPRRPG
jgi:hypothetical protein